MVSLILSAISLFSANQSKIDKGNDWSNIKLSSNYLHEVLDIFLIGLFLLLLLLVTALEGAVGCHHLLLSSLFHHFGIYIYLCLKL